MGFRKWIPWQMIARKAAKAYGFNDPVSTLERIRRFSRPSETNEPIELLRAGFAFHARGLANTKAIQNNLDWVWPYWIERQYDPADDSFIPRAFSFSHINLTHRNWTALSLPGSENYSIVDPRGLITPFHDSWSIDFWIVSREGKRLYPSKAKKAWQTAEIADHYSIETRCKSEAMELTTRAQMGTGTSSGSETLKLHVTAKAEDDCYLAIALRPYNPEGIQFIDKVTFDEEAAYFSINDSAKIHLPPGCVSYSLSNYSNGDVSHSLFDTQKSNTVECEAGMATAAALYKIQSGRASTFTFSVPIVAATPRAQSSTTTSWSETLAGFTQISLPVKEEQTQFEQSLLTLTQLSQTEIYPGPYTYKRFWFRDACLIAHALLRTGQFETCQRAIEAFPARQSKSGYFLSQEGEWDSNGQVLWLYGKYEELSGKEIPSECLDTIEPAIDWIEKKRTKAPDTLHHGLLPAGFSAEHFGPNDHYYWDDLWAVAGLKSAARILEKRGKAGAANRAKRYADDLWQAIEASLQNLSAKSAKGKFPASPYRRMDAGAIGSLVADYPLGLIPAEDPRIQKTASFLYENCTFDSAFFQDMIHSGLNIYLTLDLAQTFLRSGDSRWEPLMEKCLQLASPTGQWPEAIHPKTAGGCMGDGQHAWAAAEWALFTLDRIVRFSDESLIIGSGVSKAWLRSGKPISLQNAPTPFGEISLSLTRTPNGNIEADLSFDSQRTDATPEINYSVPGYTTRSGRNLKHAILEPEHQPVHSR